MQRDLTGKVALVGGATSGIGKGIAYALARLNVSVGVIARNEILGKEVVADLRSINPSGTYEVIMCDASSIRSIKSASEIFTSKFEKLNYLVLSQGIGTLSGRNETPEGIDNKLALHYYGRFAFIDFLTPIMQKTAETEDVRVGSILAAGVHEPYPHLDDLPLKHHYSIANAANAGCFYNDLALDQFSRKFSGPNGHRVSFIHANPGFVNTNWGKDFPLVLIPLLRLVQYFGNDPMEYGKFFVQNAFLSDEFGSPDISSAASAVSVTDGSATHYAAGFRLMTASCQYANATRLQNDLYRDRVWNHTKEVLAEALLV